mmetsp:Transcript_4967/g.5825  ORF Transcript_4967/g.5825 Transcript_4967/m.5825 type:complete len:142 (-) Transcript_4967:61-486(-)
MNMLLNKGMFQGKRILKEETVNIMVKENQLDGKDVTDIHRDVEVYGSNPYYKGMGWNLAGWVMIDKEKAFGAEFSEVGEWGWSGIGGTWFALSEVPSKQGGNLHRVGILFMSQVGPDKGLPWQPQFRFLAMRAVRNLLDQA